MAPDAQRALITGGTGFLGGHLTQYLAGQGWEVTVGHLGKPVPSATVPGTRSIRLDVVDSSAVKRAVERWRPDVVYHLAGQAYIPPSWKDPASTFRTNFDGTRNVLDALAHRPRTSLGFAGSGTEYGAPKEVPTPETAELRPASPYAVSKACADLLCHQYFVSWGIPTYRFRIFGTTGPGKLGDACNDFARQIVAAESNGGSGTVRVGSLAPRRDISDVRDAVRAMVTIVERGTPGEAYNIGSGTARSIRSVLQGLRAQSLARIRVVDTSRLHRPADEPIHEGDITRLRRLGWRARCSWEETLASVLSWWRERPD
ncbi:MAG: GDP-mannose 4,6-dehydratase [Thermoplasmata archaeon]|nr:GDP-mannose 4,6-dehydratase [Thermoplasmata archaeon]